MLLRNKETETKMYIDRDGFVLIACIIGFLVVLHLGG